MHKACILLVVSVVVLAGRSSSALAATPFSTEASGDRSIVAGPDGNLWFRIVSGAPNPIFGGIGLGRPTPTGDLTVFAGVAPNDLTVGPDGNLWFTTFGPIIGRTTGAVLGVPRAVAVFRGATGQWFLRSPASLPSPVAWGNPALGDVPVPVDFDGDGRPDLAVYRQSTGQWLLFCPIGGGLICPGAGFPGAIFWGGGTALGDLALPRDYDGDGRADLAVYRSTTGEWLIRRSTDGSLLQVPWGSPVLGDVPVPGPW